MNDRQYIEKIIICLVRGVTPLNQEIAHRDYGSFDTSEYDTLDDLINDKVKCLQTFRREYTQLKSKYNIKNIKDHDAEDYDEFTDDLYDLQSESYIFPIIYTFHADDVSIFKDDLIYYLDSTE